MSIDIRLPNITATTDAGKLQQLQGYLYQMVGQLNWALNNIDTAGGATSAVGAVKTTAAEQKRDPVSDFNSIKGLIIKSADIVNAYYEEIDALLKLSGEYVAEATFPEGSAQFIATTNLSLSANSNSIEQIFSDMQEIVSNLESVNNQLVAVNAHIKTGLLYYDENGVPVYGLEVGQRSEVNGEEIFNKYARFTANKLSFYDKNDNEVAYISDYKIYITHVEITGSLTHGGFVDTVMDDKSIVTKWVGG